MQYRKLTCLLIHTHNILQKTLTKTSMRKLCYSGQFSTFSALFEIFAFAASFSHKLNELCTFLWQKPSSQFHNSK